jgi:hypothetical protein
MTNRDERPAVNAVLNSARKSILGYCRETYHPENFKRMHVLHIEPGWTDGEAYELRSYLEADVPKDIVPSWSILHHLMVDSICLVVDENLRQEAVANGEALARDYRLVAGGGR